MIGERLKHHFTGCEAWILSYREECFDQIGLRPSLRTPLFNGSLECELRKYQLFSGKLNDMRAGGGNIKSAEERRMMAEKRRFKQNREFKDRLEETPEARLRKSSRRDARQDDKRKSAPKDIRKKDFRRENGKTFERGDRRPFSKDGRKGSPREDEKNKAKRGFAEKRNSGRQ